MVKYRGAEWIGKKGVLITSGKRNNKNERSAAILLTAVWNGSGVCVSEVGREIT